MNLRRSRRGQRGASMVEFVLSFTVVIFLIFSMFEMIMLFYSYSTLTDAAKEGVRYAIVHGHNNPTDVSNVQTAVQNFANLSLHDVSGMTVTVRYYKDDGTIYTESDGTTPITNSGVVRSPGRVSVTVSYPYIPYLNLPWGMPTIHASAQGRITN